MTIHASAPAASRSTAAIRQLVGNTPLLEVLYRRDGRERRLYAKYESMNMTGSVKDRMACHILAEAYANDVLQPAYDRRGEQRQHRHRLRRPRGCTRPSGAHLHAGLDEPGAARS
jgi:hypothetical protein